MEILIVALVIILVYFIFNKFLRKQQNENLANRHAELDNSKKELVDQNKLLSSQAAELKAYLHLKSNSIISIVVNKMLDKSSSTVKFSQSDIQVLKLFSEICKIVVIFSAQSDDEEKVFIDQITKILSFVPHHRILCYENDIGKIAFVRQLKCDCHIDDNLDVCKQLRPFVTNLFCHDPSNLLGNTTAHDDKIHFISCLEEFL